MPRRGKRPWQGEWGMGIQEHTMPVQTVFETSRPACFPRWDHRNIWCIGWRNQSGTSLRQPELGKAADFRMRYFSTMAFRSLLRAVLWDMRSRTHEKSVGTNSKRRPHSESWRRRIWSTSPYRQEHSLSAKSDTPQNRYRGTRQPTVAGRPVASESNRYCREYCHTRLLPTWKWKFPTAGR